jgi:cyclopropane fatty-acyl-phospholipid synthase-like methyltransferase
MLEEMTADVLRRTRLEPGMQVLDVGCRDYRAASFGAFARGRGRYAQRAV